MFQKVAKCRQTFKLVDKDVLRWFPGHMDTGMKQMQHKLINVDCIIEVHDARMPLSGRNPNFKKTICGIKPHILVLNKKDLTDSGQNTKVCEYLQKHENIEHIVYTNGKDQQCKGLKKLFPLMQELVKKSDRYHRNHLIEHTAMIIGVPNVGKSSIINMLRSKHTKKGSGTAVGAIAGITRSVLNRIKISEDPPIYVFDTPGILTPNVKNVEAGMKLALCAGLPDHLVGEDIIADYLLYYFNKHEKFNYVRYMGLEAPSDSISEVLTKSAVYLNKYKKIKINNELKMYPDFLAAARYMTKGFREGTLGKYFLDWDILNPEEKDEDIRKQSLS